MPFHFTTKFRKIHFISLVREIYRKIPLPRLFKLLLKKKFFNNLILNSQKNEDYTSWIRSFDTLTESDKENIKKHIFQFKKTPVISIIMSINNVSPRLIEESIQSILTQIYQNWELCIITTAESEASIRTVLSNHSMKYQQVKIIRHQTNENICISLNSAIGSVKGEFITILGSNDILSEHALYFVAWEINLHPEANLIYSDEDKIDFHGKRHSPYFKPDWNPDLFRSQNMISRLVVFRTSLVNSIGGYRNGFEEALDWDLSLRITEQSKDSQIRHIPRILYHARAIISGVLETESRVNTSAQKALISHCERTGRNANVLPIGPYFRLKYALPSPAPNISFVMPSKCQLKYLAPCIESFLYQTNYKNFEILLLVNEIRWKNPSQSQYLKSIQKIDSRIRVISYPDQPFNFSKINNLACSQARFDIIGFVNDDLEAFDPDWLEEMASQICRPDVAVVGAKLFYPDDTIQHSGVTFWLGGIADQRFKSLHKNYISPFGLSILLQNIGCVTAGCMLIKKSVFTEVGGFDENLAVKFNDIDLCHKVLEKGYRITWTPYAQLYHHESVSIGGPDSKEKMNIYRKEKDYIIKKWKNKLPEDPFYNPNLSIEFPYYCLAFPPRVENQWEKASGFQTN